MRRRENKKKSGKWWVEFIYLTSLVGVIALGQLERMQLSAQISFYAHDVMIAGYVIYGIIKILGKGERAVEARKKWMERIKKTWQKHKKIMVASGIVLGLGWIGEVIRIGSGTGGEWTDLVTAGLYLGRLGVYILFFGMLMRRKMEWGKCWFGLLGVMFLVGGIAQYLGAADMRWLKPLGWDEHYGRMVGTLWDPAFLGLVLVWLCLKKIERQTSFSRGTLISERSHSKKTFVANNFLIIITFMAILVTYSRSSYLALIAGAVILGWQRWGEKIKKYKKMAAVIAVGVMAVFIMGLGVINKGEMVSTNLLRTESIRERVLHLQKYTFDLTAYQWVVGRGMFVTKAAEWDRVRYPHMYEDERSVKQTAYMGDNMFLTMLGFTGIAGLGIFIYILIKVIKRISKIKPELLPFIAAWIVVGQFNNALLAPFVILVGGFLLVEELMNVH